MSTMNATSFERAAAIGAMIPPSLWPIRPNLVGVDVRSFLQESRAPDEHVAREVLACRGLDRPGRSADSAVVDRRTAIPRRVR